MHTSTASDLFDGVEPNPLADAFCSEHEARIEALADLLWPSVELDKPTGIEFNDDGRYRPATDEESRTLRLELRDKFTILAGHKFEEQVAIDLESAAATLLDLANRIRSR